MLGNIKLSISNKIQEHIKMQKENEIFEESCRINKENAVKLQNEIKDNLTCPICGNKEFYTNLYLSCYGYSNMEREVRFMSSEYMSDITSFQNAIPQKTGHAKINHFVCKKCGYLIQMLDMNTLDMFTFRPNKQE